MYTLSAVELVGRGSEYVSLGLITLTGSVSEVLVALSMKRRVALCIQPTLSPTRTTYQGNFSSSILTIVPSGTSPSAKPVVLGVSRKFAFSAITTNPSVLAELKYRGVPDAVIKAMGEAPYG